MSLSDTSVILPGKGTAFSAPIGATLPDYHLIDPENPTTFDAWECLGHTSIENAVALSKDGGEGEQKGSWWAAALRNRYTSINWSLTINALQMDKTVFDLAFNGAVDTSDTINGGYIVPDKMVPVERALFLLMFDGTGRLGLHFPKATITIGEGPEFSPENFVEVQLAASPLGTGGQLFKILHPNFDHQPPPTPES